MPDLAFALPGSILGSIPILAHPVRFGKETDLGTGAANWPCPSGGKDPGWRFGCTVGFFDPGIWDF